MKYFASVSFGKDSLAMLLMIIEKELPLDEVVFYDTGMEFQAIYDTRDSILPILKDRGIKYTENPKTVDLTEVKIIVDGKRLNFNEMLELSLNDGFEDIQDFFNWFNKDFTGKIIHWTNKRY